MQRSINYQATKTAARFHLDSSRVRLLLGPVGCGKSVANCLEIVRRAREQEPGSDGVRRSRWAVIRNTYPELKATTIKTWQMWVPEETFGPIKWSSPVTHHLKFEDVDCEVIFLALDGIADIKKLMSFELTGIYINEMQFIPKAVFDICLQRINRYPSRSMGAPITWTGLISDTNPPDNEHWIYRLFEEKLPPDYAIFKYEPALKKVKDVSADVKSAFSLTGTLYINNEEADYNHCQNDTNYWLSLVNGYDDEQIKIYLMGHYGLFIDGRPVHPEYNDSLHFTAKSLPVDPTLPLGLGWDFGLTPACAIVQVNQFGQMIVLNELFSDSMSLRDFAENVVLPWLEINAPNWRKNCISRHDPAGQTGSQTDGKTCQGILEELGIPSEPAASSNAPTARRDGLKYFLRKLINGEPGFLLTFPCKRLRKALSGGYQYERLRGVDDKFHDRPKKDHYSHISEALEYIAMHFALSPNSHKEDNIDELLRQMWFDNSNYSGEAML